MAGKKAKPRKTFIKRNVEGLKPSDILCPICRTILIEPVTLSCNHAFCKLCFEGSMENANLVCPLCRVRVGSWFRKAKKEGQLIDEQLWIAIQTQYPLEVMNKSKGIDNVIETDNPIIIVATPGEIRKEYEQQKQKELEEQRRIREAEEKASAPLIKKLQEEEEERNRLEEENLRMDEELAKKLAKDVEKPSSSKCTYKKVIQVDRPKKQETIDKFMKTGEKSMKNTVDNDDKKKQNYKTERKRISITPNLDFKTKEYTCHVLDAESGTSKIEDHFSIFRKSNCNRTYSSGIGRCKLKKSRKIEDLEERKCLSGYKSSGSGSDDAIDQECKFYFKPIDTQKRYHIPGTVPIKIPSCRGKQAANVYIEPPSGKIVQLQLGSLISAFAGFSKPELQTSSHKFVEKQLSSIREKRKRSEDDCPLSMKERRQIYSRKNVECFTTSSNTSSPFYGFDNDQSCVANCSPFYGFDTLSIKESAREQDSFKNLISKQNQNLNDNPVMVAKDNFKVYGKNLSISLQSKNKNLDSDTNLNLRISKTPSNGINMLEAIRNKLTELQYTIGKSENINCIATCVDVNKNVPKPKTIERRFSDFNPLQSSLDSNSTDANMTFKVRNVENHVKDNKYDNFQNIMKPHHKDVDFRSNNINMSEIRYNYGDNKELGKNNQLCMSMRIGSSVEEEIKLNPKSNIVQADSERLSGVINSNSDLVNLESDRFDLSRKNSKLNGSRSIKDECSSKIAQKDFFKSDENLKTERLSPILRTTRSAAMGYTQAKTVPTVDDSSLNNHFQNKMKNNSNCESNHKLTETYSKVKSSPSKSSSANKKVKLSSPRAKINNNTSMNLKSAGIEYHEKQIQEYADYELAKQLQAKYDSIQLPSRTRRGTKRQITLDEMLSV